MKRVYAIVITLSLGAVCCSRLTQPLEPPQTEPAGTTPTTELTAGTMAAPPSQATVISSQPTTLSADLDEAAGRRARLEAVSHWFYYLGFEPDSETLDKLVASTYDMVVIEPLVTEQENTGFPIADLVARLHDAPHPKLVMAYIDIGQAEEWRTYWQPGWQIGDPDWIIAVDPDGWEGNYPVAYWREEWREIWLGQGGYLPILLEAGFDGVYLDWIEAYSDENVVEAAEEQGVDPVEAMKRWVADLADFGRDRDPGFIVIAQNAAELAEHEDYLSVIDAIAQEQTWFDGGADNRPPGDCPLPRTESEVDSEEYAESLSPPCRRQYEQYPESTLHVSSEWYLHYLALARHKGTIIFTVDYALDPENVSWVYRTARGLGFIPFVSERELSIYLEPVP